MTDPIVCWRCSHKNFYNHRECSACHADLTREPTDDERAVATRGYRWKMCRIVEQGGRPDMETR